MDGGKNFEDQFQPEAARKNSVGSIERGTQAFSNLSEALDYESGYVGIRDVVQTEGAMNADWVGEGILWHDFGKCFEEGSGGVGRTDRGEGEGSVHSRTCKTGGRGCRQTG